MPASSIPSTVQNLSTKSGFQSIVESIMMEAAEKCEEIDVRCDEEYQVLRRKEISEQGEIIEKIDQKRREAVMRDDRVCTTKLINNFRLAQLKAKNDICNDIFTAVKQRVSADNSGKYKKLIENSLTQAMFMMMEPEVYVTCKKKDQNIISSTFPAAVNTYEKNTQLRVNVGFSKNSLPDNSSSGGMMVANKSETITVNCLLDSRVDQVCNLAMPIIVEMLYAGNPIFKESPKLSLQKALSPAAQDGPTCRLLEELQENDENVSPPPHGLLQERLGVGTSSINILGPASPMDDRNKNERQGNPSDGDRTENSEPEPNPRRSSTTKRSNAQRFDKQGPSGKK